MKAVRWGGLAASSLGNDFTLPLPRRQRFLGRKPRLPIGTHWWGEARFLSSGESAKAIKQTQQAGGAAAGVLRCPSVEALQVGRRKGKAGKPLRASHCERLLPVRRRRRTPARVSASHRGGGARTAARGGSSGAGKHVSSSARNEPLRRDPAGGGAATGLQAALVLPCHHGACRSAFAAAQLQPQGRAAGCSRVACPGWGRHARAAAAAGPAAAPASDCKLPGRP